MRRKSKRRLTFLAIFGILLLGLAYGGYRYRKHVLAQQILAERTNGIAAFDQKDYKSAVRSLARYIRFHSDDAEALQQYARALVRLPAPGRRELSSALSAFRSAALLRPEDVELRRELTDLFVQLGFVPEALKSARVLQRLAGEDDPTALKALAISYSRQEKLDEAYEAARRYVEIEKSEFRMALLFVSLSGRKKVAEEEILEFVKRWRAANPRDEMGRLLLIQALIASNDRSRARTELLDAARTATEDPEFARLLVDQLGSAGLFDDALAFLERTAVSTLDLDLLRELVRRLWERGRAEKVLEIRERARASDVDSDPDLLGYTVLSLRATDPDAEVKSLLDRLDALEEMPRARAWALYLTRVALKPGQRLRERVEGCLSALGVDPTLAVARLSLGEAYERMGEPELAALAYRETARHSRTWAAPYARLAEVLLRQGYVVQARGLAQQARALDPEDETGRLVLLLAETAQGPRELTEERLKELEGLASSMADGPALLASELARSGRVEEARAALERALEEGRDLTQSSLLLIAQTARRFFLGEDLEDRCLKQVEERWGGSPEVAALRATRLAMVGQPEKGLSFLDEAARRAGPEGSSAAWGVARARLLEGIGRSEEAASAWARLVRDHPEDLAIQREALASASFWRDRDAVRQAVTNLHTLTGERAHTWKVANARLVLSTPEATEEEIAGQIGVLRDVVSTTPEMIEARRVLAAGLERIGRYSAAVEHLEAAANSPRGRVADDIALARLLIRTEEREAALRRLDFAVRRRRPTPAEQAVISAMLAQLGEVEQALALLDDRTLTGASSDAKLLLAKLYVAKGDWKSARAVISELLEEPSPSIVEGVAALYAIHGEPEEARKAISLLGQLDLPPGERDLLEAEHLRRFADPRLAVPLYRSAVRSEPTSAKAWTGLLKALVILGDGEAFEQALEDSRRAVPENSILAGIREHSEEFRFAVELRELRPLLLRQLDRPDGMEPVLSAIRAFRRGRDEGLPLSRTVDRLVQIADSAPGNSELKILAAQGLAEVGRYDEALSICKVLLGEGPGGAAAAQLATMVYMTRGRWSEAEWAAQEWWRRAPESRLSADLTIADARLRLGKIDSALRRLKVWLPTSKKEPGRFPGLLTLYAYSLSLASESAETRAEVRELLDIEASIRTAWLRLLTDRDAGSVAQAARWLEAMKDAFSSDPESRVAFAEAWLRLAERPGGEAFRERARRQLSKLEEERTDFSALQVARVGYLEEALGQTEKAARTYEAALRMDEGIQVAANNLAMILVRDEGRTPERLNRARRIVEKLTADAPGEPEFWDTRAEVHRARREWADAASAYRAAWRLQPTNWRWPVSIAEMWLEQGVADRAAAVIREMEEAKVTEPPPETDLGRRLQRIREGIR